ncbi:hypothetical protein [Actinomadura hibisca]|uniref:hypothetical protein n=1 Tax=Actinomadura hibisca TaxID=68565 RepID=UPI0008352A00|nr:hypothetical protein [Actinomadura hibisca]
MPTDSPSTPIRLLSVATLTCLGIAVLGACEFPPNDKADAKRREPAKTAPPAAPIPALAEAEVTSVLARFALQSNLARKRLDPKLAATSFTQSSLQMETAKYRVFRTNKTRIASVQYGQVLGASPLFSGHPRWFFAALTDRVKPVTRDIVVFVQQGPGQPWRAAYTPLATKPTQGPLGPGIDVADNPEVVPVQDPSLALSPDQVPVALAQVLNRGVRTPQAKGFVLPTWVRSRAGSPRTDRAAMKRSGWDLTGGYAASQQPVYAVRTKSGGALVWSAVEDHRRYRKSGAGNPMTWSHRSWGDLLKPFIGRSKEQRALTTVERYEVLAYVPPKGKGRVRLLADRWAAIDVRAR